jgi:N-acetylglucosaminyl-diphospho-decaprenol L-rhamnosyltransferase
VLTAVIVHRRQPAHCVATGRELLAQGVDRLVVVDNDSPAEDVAQVRAGLPAAVLLELGANTGFGPGANAGLRHWLDGGEGDWVVLCPHDAQLAAGCVAGVLAAARARPRAGLACAEFGEGVLNARPTVRPVIGGIVVPSAQVPGWESCDYPHGTLLVANRACLEDIGLFDERYFAYCEEADLGMRATAAGWEVGIVWGAVVRNAGLHSESGVPEYLMLRNSLWLVREHFGRRSAALGWLVAAWVTVRASLGGRPPIFWHRRARFLALRDFVLGRWGPPPQDLLDRAAAAAAVA